MQARTLHLQACPTKQLQSQVMDNIDFSDQALCMSIFPLCMPPVSAACAPMSFMCAFALGATSQALRQQALANCSRVPGRHEQVVRKEWLS